MALDRHKTIRQALEYVDRNPEWPPDNERLDMPIWEMVARNLFEHANTPNVQVIGSVGRAIRAQRIILDRLTGTRRVGTHPAVKSDKKIEFVDLTQVAVPAPIQEQEDPDEQ